MTLNPEQPQVRVAVLSHMPVPGDEPVELLCGGGRALLKYWVARISGGGRASVTFEGVRKVALGAPNEEALSGHRLAQNGLLHFSFHEVHHSDWITDLMNRNSVHHRHADELFAGVRHFIATFKDETFECVARTIAVAHDKGAELP
jgi:hypothetical protein